MSWRDALLRQASSDLTVYDLLAKTNAAKCHRLHYLQMAGEKLAKSESPEVQRGEPPPLTHFALGNWLRALSLSRVALRSMGYGSTAEFRQARTGLVRSADAVEGCAPAIANRRSRDEIAPGLWNGLGTNAEYPWTSALGQPVAPAEYAFNEPELDDLRLVKLASFMRRRIESVTA